MERFRALLTALGLFLVTVLFCHGYAAGHISMNPAAFSAWTDESKSQSWAGLRENMTEETLPVFGSSEFQHGTDTPYHPVNVFEGRRVTPMLIGAGYYQCLSHAVTLAAIEDGMEQRKAVLILSPQWFRKTGVVDQAYTSRFSELLYQKMLVNDALSEETKDYISKRTHKLLASDETTLSRVERDEELLWKGETEGKLTDRLWTSFLEEKDRFNIAFRQILAGIRESDGKPEEGEPDWEALLELAQSKGALENDNAFYIENESYRKLEPYLPEKKEMNADAEKGYQTGPEFDDLRCFLTVCAETGVRPMLVLVPVNGYYYDYTAFPVSARAAYYEKIRGIAREFDALVADFSGEEYTRYFFEDRVHLGKKGWVKVSEAIWRFAEEEN